MTPLKMNAAGPDTIAPILKTLIIPKTLDLSRGSANLTFSATAIDDISGVKQVVVWFDKGVSYSYSAANTDFSNYALFGLFGITDSWADNASQNSYFVNSSNQGGIYTVAHVDVQDMQGNTRTYSTAELATMGVNTQVQFLGATADTTAPVLTSLVIPKTLDLTNGSRNLTLSATATDDVSGVKQVVVWLDKGISYAFSPASGDFSNYNLLGVFGIVDSWSDGASTSSFFVNSSNPRGVYNVTRVDVRDMQGNSRSYEPGDLVAMGINTRISVLPLDPVPAATPGKFVAFEAVNMLSLPGTREFGAFTFGDGASFTSRDFDWTVAGTGSNFSYNDARDPSNGILQTLTYSHEGRLAYRIDGLNYNTAFDPIELGVKFGGVLLSGALAELSDILKGNDTIVGSAFGDVVAGFGGNDQIDGGTGLDTAVYAGQRSAFKIESTGGAQPSTYVEDRSGANGRDTLVNVERLKFLDRSVALDFADNGHAAVVAKIIGAVFGAQATSNQGYVGIGLNYLDSGMGYESLMQLALDTRLGASASDAAIVDLLYGNVIGHSPSDAERQSFVDLLSNGTYSRGALGVLAAETAENSAAIDLVGLARMGLDFA